MRMWRSTLFLFVLLFLVPSVSSAASCVDINRTLSLNMKGNDVSTLQKFLRDNATYTGKISGTFGRLTEASVKTWQRKKGITATGTVGPLTRTAMRCSSTKSNTSKSSQKTEVSTAKQKQSTSSSQPYTQSEATTLIRQRIMPSMVQIRCSDRDGGEESSIGSGVYGIDPNTNKPMVATNAHVVLGRDGLFHGCNVYFPRASDGTFYDSAYVAGEVVLYHNVQSRIASQIVNGIDYAVLTLTAPGVDGQGLKYPFPPKQEDALSAMTALCRKKDNINIGDPIFVIGYPAVGQSSLTLTQGVIGGFLGQFNEKIKVSATTLSGNSGGLAIGSTDICEYGIPTQATSDARVGGNLGFLLSTSFINAFLENMTGGRTYTPPDASATPSTYLTRTYSLPDFNMNYPELWTVSRTERDSMGSENINFISPSEGVLDDFSERVSIAINPNSTQDHLTSAVELMREIAIELDPDATEKIVTLGGRIQANYIIYEDIISGINVLTATEIFLENGKLYIISFTISNGSNAKRYTNLTLNMLKSITFKVAQAGQVSQTASALASFENFLTALQNALKTK